MFDYQWTEKKDKVQTINLGTNSTGEWSQQIKLDKEGEYDIKLTGYDSAGNKIQSQTSMYVYGEGQASFSFDDTTSLNLKANKTELKVGEQGQLIIESPYPKAKAFNNN